MGRTLIEGVEENICT